jgi:hypothetical protein
MPSQASATQAVGDAVRRVTFGPVISFENLSLVPLLGDEERDVKDVEYLTLDEAVAGGSVQVTEVSDAGQVSELKVVVTGDKPVLLLDGEELIGAKQNRVVNLTILAPPGRTTVIPVSCVESGRWRHVSRGLSSSPRAQFAEGRAARVRQVTTSMAAGHYRSNQGAVWSLIAEKASRLNAASPTSAMSAVFDRLGAPLEDFVAAFPPIAHQIGAAFLVNGRPAGLELFDAVSTWRKLSPKLVRSYAVDAIDGRRLPTHNADANAPAAFTTAVQSSPTSVFPSIGEGEDVRLTGADIAGAALVARGRVIHVSAFPQHA